ncbi:MAG: hypothetical protein JRI34_05795, partial [Deltaproteobacteria bacterium]|nr:hypothetical protein [Deltaproteobacteria bacterium]
MKKKLLMSGRVLLIARDSKKRDQIVTILQQQGFEIRGVEDHLTAGELCRVFKPDVIVFCIETLREFKYEANKCLFSQGRSRSPHLLVIHSSRNDKGKSSAIKAGANEFLIWPVKPEELLHRITVAIRLRRSREELIKKADRLEIALDTIRRYNTSFSIEFEEAHKLQQVFYPGKRLALNGFGVNFFIRSAKKLCGDYIDIIRLDTFRVALILIDVSGHGAAAALVTG